MSLSDILASLKTFTWSFSVGYNPTTISTVAFDEDEARKNVLALFSDITEKNKEYLPLKKRLGQINNKMWFRMTDDKKDLETQILRISYTFEDIKKFEAEKNDLENELENDPENESLQKEKDEITKRIVDSHTRLESFEQIEVLKEKLRVLEEEYEILRKESSELDEKIHQLESSIEANKMTGPYTVSVINLTLDFETGSDETIRQILEKSPEMKPFCATTIFSALDG